MHIPMHVHALVMFMRAPPHTEGRRWMLSCCRCQPTQAVVAATIASLGVAMSDVVVDSLVVERAPLTEADA